jgi:hypothetical protein
MNKVIVFLWLACVAFLASSAIAQDRPNVLFISIDDLRPELGCYGSKVAITPNLDKLVEQGLLFERAYCNYPICGASRASMLSGLYPTSKRFVGLAPLDQYEPKAVTLPQAFKQQGYTTLSNGKIFHNTADANERSWSEPAWRPGGSPLASLHPATRKQLSKKKRGYIVESPDVPDNAYFDGKVAEKTIADLKRLKEEGKPFFLACGFVRPHLPFYAPKQHWDLYDRDKLPLADNRFRPSSIRSLTCAPFSETCRGLASTRRTRHKSVKTLEEHYDMLGLSDAVDAMGQLPGLVRAAMGMRSPRRSWRAGVATGVAHVHQPASSRLYLPLSASFDLGGGAVGGSV